MGTTTHIRLERQTKELMAGIRRKDESYNGLIIRLLVSRQIDKELEREPIEWNDRVQELNNDK